MNDGKLEKKYFSREYCRLTHANNLRLNELRGCVPFSSINNGGWIDWIMAEIICN